MKIQLLFTPLTQRTQMVLLLIRLHLVAPIMGSLQSMRELALLLLPLRTLKRLGLLRQVTPMKSMFEQLMPYLAKQIRPLPFWLLTSMKHLSLIPQPVPTLQKIHPLQLLQRMSMLRMSMQELN